VETRFRQEALDPDQTTGLILCGMGGPDGPHAVQPFLRNLFNDPLIIGIPGLIRPLLSRLIAWRRTPKVRERYAVLGAGGGSPQLDWTQQQADYIKAKLNEAGLETLTHLAMSYWHPFAHEALANLCDAGAKQFLILPMYPQYAEATSTSILSSLHQALRDHGVEYPVHTITNWQTLPGLVDTVAGGTLPLIEAWRKADRWPETCALVFVAHSLPMRQIKRGDPYPGQIDQTLQAVHGRLRAHFDNDPWWRSMIGGEQPMLTFQSRVGPIKWMGPDIVDEVQRLGEEGCRHLTVVPLSFTCEHIETMHELDIELRETAEEAGIMDFSRTPALNMDPRWLDSMADHLMETAWRK
jgi:protoporphyrin/coproporphyrin ferrochelatase